MTFPSLAAGMTSASLLRRATLIRLKSWMVLWPVLFLLSFLQATAAAPAGSPRVIIAFGDSLTAGYGLAATDSIPVRLEAELRARGKAVTIVNAGVSGDTSSGGRARLDWVLASIGQAKPALVILELGANDALRGIDPKLTEQNLDAMLTTLKARGIPVLLCGMMAPPNMGKEYGAAFNALYPALAKKHGIALDPFFLAGVAARPDLNQPDGMHPNAKGARLIASRLAPVVAALLTERQPAKPRSRP